MEGIIMNFRSGKHTQYNDQMIIQPNGCDDRESAAKLVGKTVVWKSPADKEIKGEIRSAHGGKGAVRVIFEKGMPGQSIGGKVMIQ